MRTVSIFKNNSNQAIRIPRDMEFQGVSELEIIREGDTLILRPARPSWGSLRNTPPADADFLLEREDVIDENRLLDDLK
ncbi:type II toxin-antitoxin system VapB family antitoxin [Pusillimonas sp. ANT_WB101]|uniref:type II toxin-antitoxin system VapB family antitoxin n=1 Tax=Pusillimonas sp. ANT_WB101 TaxID=2597356 RepID=UPI0011EDBC9C|nr:type II toxin-antitoxin system VapB family antitoxin [Pusillimonas sp. ANT_WB101]KAA0892720.1 AbrB/MazE/SpoVT family DNA-binding domain-containing protein [Pusillimonas sp. ANT_WB101]